MSNAAVSNGMAIPFLELGAQHRAIESELLEVFTRALRSGTFIGGPEVASFEDEFAKYAGTTGSAAISSGTDALRFAIMAMGVKPGDEVITVPNTFIATTEAISQAGASIRFVDVRPDTLNMDPRALEAAIGPRTVGVVPVHLFGQIADMNEIQAVASKHGLWVIEDAAQAVGARLQGRPAGSLADLAAFSFYPGKNLGALGEGGAVTGVATDRLAYVRKLRDHGQASKYFHDVEGFNGRLDAIQCGFLRVKLRRLDDWTAQRRRVAKAYDERLSGVGDLRLPVELEAGRHVYHLYVIRTAQRDRLFEFLGHQRIGSGLHYPLPLHLQKAYAGMRLPKGAFPVTEAGAEMGLSLPMYPELSEGQIDRVVESVREFFGA